VPEVRLRHFLPALLGSLYQQQAEGELILEQNDGTRRLYWSGGDLVYLRSDAVGEQFGNFLIRRGILDMASLKELLADGDGARVGDRVVQWGLMTVEERDSRLNELLGSVLLHAMEHPILKMTWLPGPLQANLSGDLQFWIDHRRLVWDTFQNAKIDRELLDMFRSEPSWRWVAKPDLLEFLRDLPLTPTLAYALTLLGNETLGWETIGSLSGLPSDATAKLVATLWALGGLRLVQGELPLLSRSEPQVVAQAREPEPEPEPKPEPKPKLILEPEPELEITLVDEDSGEPAEGPRRPRPLNLMDILELDATAPPQDPFSPAGPPPKVDPFSPAGPPPKLETFSPAGPPPSRAHFSPMEPAPRHPAFTPSEPIPLQEFPLPSEPYTLPDTSGPTPSSLPMLPNEDDFPPVERARRLVIKAKSYMMQSRTSEAIRSLEQAIKLDGDTPGAYECWLLLGRLRLTNPAWSTRAVEALQVASRLNARAAEPWALMGELYHRKGFHANAQGCFRRALELDPSVAVPPDYQIEDIARASSGDGKGNIMGRLRSMMGRDRT
jgi:tetratricopeptide (TPR) repeat protein